MSKKYVPEDVLRAHSYALEILAAFMVVSGAAEPSRMAGLIRMTLAKMESEGHIKAAEYLRAMWANGLNGEWEKGWREAKAQQH